MNFPANQETQLQNRPVVSRGIIFLVGLFLALAYLSWHRLGDVLVDFGRELYVPWRITEGEILYRDIAYFNGPISPYFNAFLFQILGVSFSSTLIGNLFIIALLSVLIYRFFGKACDRTVATIVTAFFLVAFAIKHTALHGIFSFVAPYSHEMTHGIFLVVVALSVLGNPLEKVAVWKKIVGAFVVGAVFLTKPEMALAGLVTFLVWWVTHHLESSRDDRIRPVATFFCLCKEAWVLLILCAPFLFAVAILATQMEWRLAIDGALGGWRYVFSDQVRGNRFYSQVTGTNRLVPHTLIAIFQFISGCLLIGSALLLDRWYSSPSKRRIFSAIGIMLIAATINAILLPFILEYDKPPTTLWLTIVRSLVFGLISLAAFGLVIYSKGIDKKSQKMLLIAASISGCFAASMGLNPTLIPQRSLPIFACLTILIAAYVVFGKRSIDVETSSNSDESDLEIKIGYLLPWTCFGFLLLMKIALACRLFHYGFALAMVGMLGSIGMVTYFVTDYARRRWEGGAIAKAIWIGLVCFDMIALGSLSVQNFQRKNFQVGDGSDYFMTANDEFDPKGKIIVEALDELSDRVQPDETILVLPEGITINYLLRRTTATRYTNFMPIENFMYGESNILKSIQQSQPDYILLVHKNTGEYGYRFFGSPGYGDEIMQWIGDNYEVRKLFGEKPFVGKEDFGIELLTAKK